MGSKAAKATRLSSKRMIMINRDNYLSARTDKVYETALITRVYGNANTSVNSSKIAMDANDNSKTNPFDLFVSECNDVDIEVRINSIKKLPTVAVALDTERTKTELIPYLETLTEGIYNDDEVLLNLADQLGSFLTFVGGAENANLILNVLEKLAAIEENVVREKTIESLHNVAEALDTATLEAVFIPLVIRLADSEWFTSKSSATALFAVCYPKVSQDIKADLRNAYRVLCQDDSPLVRRSAAAKLTEFANVLELHHLKDEFIPVFDNFSKDDQDSVRVLAVDVGAGIASRLKIKEVEDFILTTLTELCGDASWRVRYQVAYQINTIQMALGHDLTRKYLVAIYQNLIHDTEPQVREASARNIVLFCQILQQTFKENDGDINDAIDPTILNQILPLIEYLDQDVNQEVKEALSTVITSLSPLLGVENTKNLLLPLITNSLLNDSSKVRENIIANLNHIISVIGISEIADTVLKIVIDLVNNSASVWRTRRNLVVTINYIAKHSGKEYFDAHLKSLYQKLLSDGVYAVRKTAPLILPILVKNFGVEWAADSIVPEFLVFAEHKHYLYRFVCLFCIDELVTPTLEAKFESATTADDIQHENRPKYLEQVRIAADERDADLQGLAALLVRIRGLSNTLAAKLGLRWVSETLGDLEENDMPDDDIKRYAEDTIEMFIRDNNLEITNVSKEEAQGGDVYLEGVLGLIVNRFMSVLQVLAKDPVRNIQLKVGKTVKKIVEFSRLLRGELKAEWVQEMLKDYVEEDVVIDEPVVELTVEAKADQNKLEESKKSEPLIEPFRKIEDTTLVQGDATELTKRQTNENISENAPQQMEFNDNKQETKETDDSVSSTSDSDKSMETELVEILEEKLSAQKDSDDRS